MKFFLAFGISKSVPELTFAKVAFSKSDFLDLVDFVTVDRFLILSPTQPLPTSLAIAVAS